MTAARSYKYDEATDRFVPSSYGYPTKRKRFYLREDFSMWLWGRGWHLLARLVCRDV